MRFISSLCVAAMSVLGKVYLQEDFNTMDRWTPSEVSKFDGQWELSSGEWYGDKAADQGLKTTNDARFYAIGAKFDEAFDTTGKDLVVQFSVKHGQKIDCGGGYVKIFPSGVDFSGLDDTSKEQYSVMFGPDICGYSTKKVHVIFTYKGKQLLTKADIKCKDDQLTHVYTLIVRPDLTYEVRIDGEEAHSGALEDDFDFLAPKEIKDPEQSKPKDWVDEPMMDDPEDVKPEGYDDIPAQISDPDAEKPDDWDDEDDGEWEAPLIDNPEYKGEWSPKQIENPDYKGPWVHPMIPNPDYEEDPNMASYTDLGAAVFDLWQVKSGTIFDNLIITDDVTEAENLLANTWEANHEAEQAMFDAAEDKRKAEEEAARKAAEDEEDEYDEDDEDDEDDIPEDDEGHDEL